ncbi:hypothetical protein FIBSPDRAFT_127053 [Athelia psychrophila]|uniref:Uncharacterized protein n=1 Tax=Athelia psychrophila TaxID=1759441 RepID=A0A166T872_9AGAM|nr:hypothetical protein FIBSPDRAFT_127053 [Fibularhizoctonia sp. CBS 109695]
MSKTATRRPAQHYAHAALGLLIISLAFWQVRRGTDTNTPSGRRAACRWVLWIVWVVFIPIAYFAGLALAPRLFNQGAASAGKQDIGDGGLDGGGAAWIVYPGPEMWGSGRAMGSAETIPLMGRLRQGDERPGKHTRTRGSENREMRDELPNTNAAMHNACSLCWSVIIWERDCSTATARSETTCAYSHLPIVNGFFLKALTLRLVELDGAVT